MSCAFHLAISCYGQTEKGMIPTRSVPAPQWHYQTEYTFDKPVDPSTWSDDETGLHAAFGTTDELYLRSEVPDPGSITREWSASGWRGERMNAQLLVWSADSLEQLRFTVTDLVSAGGDVIRSEMVTLRIIRYVVSNFPYGAGNFGCDVSSDAAYLMPDRLESFDRFDLPGRTTRPVWLSIDIDPGTAPGVYRGTIEVESTHGSIVLKLDLKVQELLLPASSEWKFRLDLWQNPWVIADYFQVEPWSEEHKLLLKKHLKLYAEAGGKYITTYAVHSPWSDNSYRIEGTMVEWIWTATGSWKFDFSIFDQYVELSMEAGIDKAITIYTPVPWGYRFRFLDEASGNYVFKEWSPDSKEFRDVWMIFLDVLKRHLTEKGWFGRTYLGINENPLEITLAASRVIKAHSPDWKITYAGDWHPELSPILDDYSVIIGQTPGQEQLRERVDRGQTTTFYVCCTPPRPNNFVFSPPVEGRSLGWFTAAQGYHGFLRWAYDAWPADPVRDARHTLWPAGDCFLVYPGANSSIRYEKLREGIADYEKITILRRLVRDSQDVDVKQLMEEFEALITSFAGASDFDDNEFDPKKMAEAIRAGNMWMEKIGQALSQ